MKYCLVYLDRIKEEKKDFVTHVPIRYKELLDKNAQIHVLYNGEINLERLEKSGIKCHQYGNSKLKIYNQIILIKKISEIAKKYQIDMFSNVWSHYKSLPIYCSQK